MSSLRDVLNETATNFVNNMNNFDGGANWPKGRTADSVHAVLPKSLGINNKLSNDEMIAFLAKTLKGNALTVSYAEGTGPIIDEEKRIIILYLVGENASAPAGGLSRMEYVWHLKTTDDGKLISESSEFLDSKTLANTSG